MNAKRKTQTTGDAAGDDQLTQDENAQLAAESEGMAPRDSRAGVTEYDPARWLDRPGQGRERDDELDRAFRAAQGQTAGAASSEWKPAEPTAVMAADEIPTNPLAYAKPDVEPVLMGRVGGAGDPQNGRVLTDWTESPIIWADTSRPIHQPPPGPLDALGTVPADPQTEPDPQTQSQTQDNAAGWP